MKRIILVPAILAAFYARGALAGANASSSLPYAKLVASQVAFAQLPLAERDKLLLNTVIRHADAANHTPIHAWVEAGGKRIDIPLAEDGAIQLPLQPDWITQDLTVQTDQPKGTLRAETDLQIAIPPLEKLTAAYLTAAASQAQAAITDGVRKMAGVLGLLFVPKVKGVEIKFDGCCKNTVRFGASTASFPENASSVVDIPTATLAGLSAAGVSASGPIKSIGPWVD
jgi:hypothetical protein